MVDSESKETLVSCPFCKESIQSGAIKCKHCGSTLVPLSENVEGSQSPSQSVQIVTNTQKTEVTNSNIQNRYWSHGWAIIMASFIFLFSVFASIGENNRELMIVFAIIGTVIIVPWFLWIMSKPSANKILPIIAILISSFTVFGFFMEYNAWDSADKILGDIEFPMGFIK